jgi:hypothetical protein
MAVQFQICWPVPPKFLGKNEKQSLANAARQAL